MLQHPARLRALAIRGLALAGLLILATAPVLAQDGQRRTGDPVDRPRTDKLIPRAETATPAPTTTDQILPPVPASIEDPAPPGTNAVPVVPNVRRAGRAAPGRRGQAMRGIRATEGVVVQIEPAAKEDRTQPGLQNELVRLRIDPSQTWDDFANLGPETPAENQAAPPDATPDQADAKPDAKAPLVEEVKTIIKDVEKAITPDDKPAEPQREANAEAEAASEEQPEPIEVVLTNRTRVFVHARSADGVDMFGAGTISSPATTPGGVDPTGRAADQPRRGGLATNFTNIKVGSYVAVRYRTASGMNEAVNVNLIELPLIAPAEGAAAPVGDLAPAPRTRAVPVPGTTPDVGDAPLPPARSVPRTVTPGNREPVREPVVPATPVVPAVPR